jgi:hypothetical protein
MDAIKLTQDDDEQLGTVFKEIMEHSEANRASPISDPSLMPDPLGND